MLWFDASPEREIPLARYQKQFLDVLWPTRCERRCFSDGELWKLWYTTMPSAEEMRAEIDRRPVLFQQGTALQQQEINLKHIQEKDKLAQQDKELQTNKMLKEKELKIKLFDVLDKVNFYEKYRMEVPAGVEPASTALQAAV